MADKLLKSIKFPTLPDRYVIGDSTLTEEGAAADAKAVGEALATKADTKGRYEDIVAGGAEQLMADVYESDSDPYLFRPTGGSADVGNREYLDKIVGGTVAWNQLVNDTNTFTVASGENKTYTSPNTFAVTSGHKYIAFAKQSVVLSSATRNRFGLRVGTNNIYQNTDSLNAGLKTWIYNAETSVTGNLLFWCHTPNADVSFSEFQFHDLTAMFGSTIADYIYSLEQAHAGDGIAWFRNYFPKDYYPYDKGTLRSVEGVSAHETVGFNAFDVVNADLQPKNYTSEYIQTTNVRTDGYIKVVAGATYNFHQNFNVQGRYIRFYDADLNWLESDSITNYTTADFTFTVPTNAVYLRVMWYSANGVSVAQVANGEVCINISSPSRNGEYEPYTKHTYHLDSSLTLRGIPKLVDGKLAYDGDVYPPSGEVQRRYGLRAYQSGDESLADAITDGTNTVYKLATPTTETAEGYEQYQICDPNGTEEFVTDSIVPVGHETRYPHDLKKKIETAPDSPSTDGTYLMKRSGGKNTYMALPSTPSANGAYVLTVTVSGGTASYSWTAKE